jgi:hypothetical protein
MRATTSTAAIPFTDAKIANGAEPAALDKFATQVVNLLVQTTSGY